MPRPIRGRKRVMLRGFSYPGEFDPFFKRLQKQLEKDGTTLSAFLLEAAINGAPRYGVKLKRSKGGAVAIPAV